MYLHPKVQGTPNPTDPIAAQLREAHQANRYAQRADVAAVYLGERARQEFKVPGGSRGPKFADVVAKKLDGSYGLGEGKGTEMDKLIKQFEDTGPKVGRITEQEVVVEKLTPVLEHDSAGKVVATYNSPGPQGKLDAGGYLLYFNSKIDKWEQARPNGVPIKVIVLH